MKDDAAENFVIGKTEVDIFAIFDEKWFHETSLCPNQLDQKASRVREIP